MSLDKSLIEKFRSVTVKSAYAASKFKGLNDKIGADKAAVDVMRAELNKIDMKGRVVIGEGELDEAPMLYIGEELGTRKGIEIDIAVDPVEGTNFVATKLVPSTGSTAMSISIPFLVPNSSPMYNIGASSNSPSPMTTLPFISILFSSALITSTAALSAPILSFNPLNLDAA